MCCPSDLQELGLVALLTFGTCIKGYSTQSKKPGMMKNGDKQEVILVETALVKFKVKI